MRKCFLANGLHLAKEHSMDQLVTYRDVQYYAESSKKVMVTKSNTEAELVALCKGITVLLACRNFLIRLIYEVVV